MRPEKPQPDAALTDVGNGKLFVASHGSIVRYCHPWKKWLIYDSTRWHIDDAGDAMRLAKETVLALFAGAQKAINTLPNEQAPNARLLIASIKRTLDHATKSQHINRVEALLKSAQSERGIPISPKSLDTDNWLLNCANGTINLRTGKLQPHNPANNITKLCPVQYDPAAKCPTFLRTVDAIFGGDDDLIGYVHRYTGYTLTGETSEHLVPIAYGSGSNGKTLFFNTILGVLGKDYAGTVVPELLTRTRGDQHPTVKTDLHGKRLMVAAETGRGAELNEERIKALSGGDAIKARRCGEDFWEFDPTHKLVLMTNHKPRVSDQDHGIWRRLALVPFTVRFWDPDKGETGPPELRANKDLARILEHEREGILAWLVRGCLEWQRAGLRAPDIVLSATKEYRSTEDRIGAFIEEQCEVNREFRVKKADLYATYKTWCDGNGERWESMTTFTPALRDGKHGITLDAGRRWYLGLKLAMEDE